MNCRVRYYQSYEDAVREWRYFRLPEVVATPVELIGTIITFIEGAEKEDLEHLQTLVQEQGGRAFRCDTAIRRMLVAGPPGLYQELAADYLGGALYESISNSLAPPMPVALPSGELKFDRTLIMGVLNVTPDSFSDGGRFFRKEDAVKRALEMADQGADIIDLGGESTRPFAQSVGKDVESERVIPVLKEIAPSLEIPISIDTIKPEVAKEALEAGAQIINDVSGLRNDDMIRLAAETQAPVILMHMRGSPQTMQLDIQYDDVIGDIALYFAGRLERAAALGIDRKKIVLDPGLGFGKTLENNLSIVRRLRELKSLGRPLTVGPSRKAFIGKILGKAETDRLEGTMAVVAASILQGASILRVHDVQEAVATAKMADSILKNQ